MAASAPSLDFCAILTESKRIINAHSRHFLALSVLFLLPLSFSLTVYPTIQDLVTKSSVRNSKILLSQTLLQDPSNPFITKTLLLSLLFSLFVFAFALFAVGSITYSVFHGFYGRPVKLASAIKSAFTSFFPLLITAFFTEIIVLGVFLLLVIKVIEFVGFQSDQLLSSPYLNGFCVIVAVVLVLVLVYLQLNWALVCVVVVVESSWGIQPLKRSWFLMEGMQRVALSLLSFFGFFVGILLWIVSVAGSSLNVGTSDEWKSWAFVLQIVVISTILVLLFLYNVAANTVLYMYSKAVHGELAVEIAEEFAREYVSLPFDDGKVPHLVSVVHN